MKVSYFINKILKPKTVIIAQNKNERISKLIEEYIEKETIKDKEYIAKHFKPNSKLPPKGKKGKNINKKKVTYDIKNEELLSDIDFIAGFYGKSKDEIVEKYIKTGIKEDEYYLISHLTKSELKHFCEKKEELYKNK